MPDNEKEGGFNFLNPINAVLNLILGLFGLGNLFGSDAPPADPHVIEQGAADQESYGDSGVPGVGKVTGISGQVGDVTSGQSQTGGGWSSGPPANTQPEVPSWWQTGWDNAVKAAEGIGGIAKGVVSAAQAYQVYLMISDPEGFAADKGAADQAYDEARYPDTNTYERLGIPGIMGGATNVTLGNFGQEQAAATSQKAAHREQTRKDKLYELTKRNLDADEKQKLAMIERTKAETTMTQAKSTVEQIKSKLWQIVDKNVFDDPTVVKKASQALSVFLSQFDEVPAAMSSKDFQKAWKDKHGDYQISGDRDWFMQGN